MEEYSKSFDICIVCALYEEARAVLEEFSKRCEVSFTEGFSRVDRYAYRQTTLQNKYGEPLKVLVTWLADSGPVRTSLDLRPILREFHPRFAAMTGLCAGYKGKVKLGDLVVAEYAYHYEEGKILRGPDGRPQHLPEMRTAGPTDQVIQYAKGFDGWREPVTKLKRQLLGRPPKPDERPNCLIGVMASGMAVRGDNPFPWLAEFRNRKTVALDMEAAAFYLALRTFPNIHALVVKSASDHGDPAKSDDYHDYAARASAVYLLYFILEYVAQKTMPGSDPSSERAGLPVRTEPFQPHSFFKRVPLWLSIGVSCLVLILVLAMLVGLAYRNNVSLYTIIEMPVPTTQSFPFGITHGPDSNLWFTENARGKIGRISAQGKIIEYLTLTGQYSNPVGITTGPDGNLWFTEYEGNKIGRITLQGTISEFSIQTGNSHPWGTAVGPDRTLWFTERDGNQIGRIGI